MDASFLTEGTGCFDGIYATGKVWVEVEYKEGNPVSVKQYEVGEVWLPRYPKPKD